MLWGSFERFYTLELDVPLGILFRFLVLSNRNRNRLCLCRLTLIVRSRLRRESVLSAVIMSGALGKPKKDTKMRIRAFPVSV